MASTYYDSQLTAEEIEAALEAVDGVIVPANNGKVLAIENGSIVAKSVTEYTDIKVLGSKTITANGTYDPTDDGYDGYDAVMVSVSGGVPLLVRPNLLDNWYFVGGGSQQGGVLFPINQRGQTSYTNIERGYCIDRWVVRGANSQISFSDYGLRITNLTDSGFNAVSQSIESWVSRLAGKTVTFSVLVPNITAVGTSRMFIGNGSGAVYAGEYVATWDITGPGLWVITLKIPTTLTNNYLNVWLTSGNSSNPGYEPVEGQYIDITAMKLELGDTQTLAHQDDDGNWVLNEIPNYQQELAKCQRYYQTYRTQSHRPTYAADCRPVMRTDPSQSTITVNGTTYYTNNADL